MAKTRVITTILITAIVVLGLSISVIVQGALLRPGSGGGLLTPTDLSGLDISVGGLTIGTLNGVLKGTSGVVSAFTGTSTEIAYWSGTNTLTGLASSTAGYVLTATETAPYFSWENHTEEAYGSLAEDTIGTGTGSTINATTVGAFYAWTGASSTISVVSGGDYMASSTTYGSTSTITIGSKGAGAYLISMSVSFSNNTANQVTHCAVFKNNVKFGRVSAETKLTTANDVKSLASSGIAPLIAGDVLDLRCANETSNTTVFTVNHASLVGLRIAK